MPAYRCFFFFSFVLQTIFWSPLTIQAATSPDRLPWNLHADKITSINQGEITEADGNVLLFQGDNYLQADYAKYYKSTHWVYLQGHIKAKWDGDYLKADQAEFDLDNRVGWLTNGQIFLETNHIYFSGRKINKTGKSTYSFSQATVTSCDDERPAWSLKTSKGNITVDGYANLWNPRLQIKGQPILYSPYLVVPVKTKRQSGFLIPNLEISQQLGAHINIPYYQIINEETDLTLYENYMSKRGIMQGLEIRYTPNLETKTLLRLDWLDDKQEYEDSNYSDTGWQRPHADRYWLRGKYNGYLFTPDWPTKLDLDIVSDYQYLREFGDGLSGFKQSRKEFLQKFKRDIDNNDAILRKNIFSIRHNKTNYGFEIRFEYIQNLKYFNDSTDYDPAKNTTLQKLPEINFNLYKNQLASTPFEWEATSQYNYFWREYGTKGSRIDLHPQISLPCTTKYGLIIPKIGWRETLYAVDRFKNTTGSRINTGNKYPTRGLPNVSIDATSNLFRIYGLHNTIADNRERLGASSWTKIKHCFTPKLGYNWIPNEIASQRKNPYFDSQDIVYPVSNLTYSITNLLTRKRITVIQDPKSEKNATTTQTDYLDFLRLKVQQSYDFREADRIEKVDTYPTRPFSDIIAELTLSPKKYMRLVSKSWYSPYLNRITEHEHTAHLYLGNRIDGYCGLDFVNRDQEYTHKTNYLGAAQRSRILELGGAFTLPKNWYLQLTYRSDLVFGKDLERKMILGYKHQCFTFTCYLSKTDTDEKIAFLITLYNLGSISG